MQSPTYQDNSAKIESVLVADCGSNTTRVVLIEVVDSAYRFVARGAAPSTLEEPHYDVSVGIINAIAAMEASTGRKLLSNRQLIVPQMEDGSGVDAFVASSSAAEAMRVVAAGLVRGLSTESAARGSHATYTTVLDTISLDDYGDLLDENGTSEFNHDLADPEAEFSPFANYQARPAIFPPDPDAPLPPLRAAKKSQKPGMSLFGDKARRAWRERQVAKLRRLAPNVVVLAGGVNGAKIDPLLDIVGVIVVANQQEAVLSEATGDSRRPLTLVFAGNSDAQDVLINRLGGRVEFFVVDNIRPVSDKEVLLPLQKQLADLYQERILPTLPGYNRLNQLVHTPINTTCAAVGLMTQFLAKSVAGNRVLTIDLGGASSSLFYANDNQFNSMVKGNFGLSFGLSNVLADVGMANVRDWLPFEANDDEIVHYALNKTLRPYTLPADEHERKLESAFGRAIMRNLYTALQKESVAAHDFNRLIGVGGGLVNVHPWQAALMLLDSFEPVGSTTTGLLELELDSTMLMAAAGALAAFNSNAAAYVFQYDCLHRLGPVIIPTGETALGNTAVTVSLTTKTGRTRQVSVPFGEIALLALRSDEYASLEIKPANGLRIGNAKAGAMVRTKAGEELRGGSVGLIIDARGRPIRFAADAASHRQQLARWFGVYAETLKMAESEGPNTVTVRPRLAEFGDSATTGLPRAASAPKRNAAPPPVISAPAIILTPSDLTSVAEPSAPPDAPLPSQEKASAIPPPPPMPSFEVDISMSPPPRPVIAETKPEPVTKRGPVDPVSANLTQTEVNTPPPAPASGRLAALRAEEEAKAGFGRDEPVTGGGALSRRTKGRSENMPAAPAEDLGSLRDSLKDNDKGKKKNKKR